MRPTHRSQTEDPSTAGQPDGDQRHQTDRTGTPADRSRHSPRHDSRHHSHFPLFEHCPGLPTVPRRIVGSILYPVLFITLSYLAVVGLQWGVNADSPARGAKATSVSDFFEPAYLDSLRPLSRRPGMTPAALKTAQENARQTGINTAPGSRIALALILTMVIYAVLIALVNRFWVGTGLFGTLMISFAVGERIKVATRNEPVLPTDLQVAAGLGGGVGSFVSGEQMTFIGKAVGVVVLFWLFCLGIRLLLGPGRIVRFGNVWAHIGTRLAVLAAPLALIVTFVLTVGTYDSPAFRFARAHGDTPMMWSTLLDAQDNGTLVSFLRLTRPRIMSRPDGYSRDEMQRIYSDNAAEARRINASRSRNLTDTTVIGVLSESFSDPLRVPGVKLNKDPMPFIRSLENQTTSGLMLSSGYGGGTANLEFQELTGLSTALLDPTTNSPYVQLVPRWTWPFSFNQMWNDAADAEGTGAADKSAANAPGSLAVHPYTHKTYGRGTNFTRKFDFRAFYTQDGPQHITHGRKIDNSPYVADSEAYQEVVDRLNQTRPGENVFVQLSTMQNHPRYQNWYKDNEFVAGSTTDHPMTPAEQAAVTTYAKGVEYTDRATQAWLEQLDTLDRPIVVFWYGDHLPGAYSAEVARPGNTLAMHETDYFIWSNQAAREAGALTRLPDSSAPGFSSPNYFMAQAAEQADAKVSPYLAFLTRMHRSVPAMQPTVRTAKNTNWSTIGKVSPNTYLDASGTQIPSQKLDREQIRLIHDYQLIEYDMTIGRHYLRDLGFTELPEE